MAAKNGGDLEDDAIVSRKPVQLLHAVSAAKGWVKENKFGEFIFHALQGMDQGGRCTVEKGIAVVQAIENEISCESRSGRISELPR